MNLHIPLPHFDRLPDGLRLVPSQVFEVTGIRTIARPITAQQKPDYFTQAEASLDIDAERRVITIWYDSNRATASSIGHELIHLRRNIIEAVPRLIPPLAAGSIQQQDVFAFENELEHLIIVPEQMAAFPEARAWWVEHYSKLVARDVADDLGLMFAWSFIRNVLPEELELAKRCAALLQKYQIVQPADYFRADLKAAGADKVELIRALRGSDLFFQTQFGVGQYAVYGHELKVRPVEL